MSRAALQKCLDKLIASLPAHPVSEAELEHLVLSAISEGKLRSSSENRKAQWEHLLKDDILTLAESEGTQDSGSNVSYHQALCDRLDVTLVFTEQDACEPTFPFTVLEDLLETQTIQSCSHIFSWIENRSARLTKGMVPQKGKALVLLRTLNDLLRRLSKTGSTTIFCGRILTFLSAVFPLGERSGVNLRGDYGPQWEDVKYRKPTTDDGMDIEDSGAQAEAGVADGNDMEMTDAKSTPQLDEKEKFYDTFWSLQALFARPTLFTQEGTFETFKASVDYVSPAIKEATVRERAMMGSKSAAGNLKRKRDATPTANIDEGNKDYFFAKYLTSPELLDLEISDTSFRRQFLFQLLILLSHLLQFTKTEKARWATVRNRSLQMDFTLEVDDIKWVQDTIARTYEELRMTSPNGRAFADTVQTVLEREKNWVKWKNDLCSPFDKGRLSTAMEDLAAPFAAKRRIPLEDYKYKLGSEALTEIWALGYRDLRDLESQASPGNVKDFVKDVEKENRRIAMRKQQLARQAQMMAAKAAVATSNELPPPTKSSEQQQSNSSASQPSAPALAIPSPVRPTLTSINSIGAPLHPSLPAKPGTKPAPSPANVPIVAAKMPTNATPAPPVAVARPPEATDTIISKAEENKQRLSWLALRTARDEHLHHFGKIGNGDIIMLIQEIEKEVERSQRGDSTGPSPSGDVTAVALGSDRASTPIVGPKLETDEPSLDAIAQAQAKSATFDGPASVGNSALQIEAVVKDDTDFKKIETETMAVDS